MDIRTGTISDLNHDSYFSREKKNTTQFRNIFKVAFDKHEINNYREVTI